MIKPQKTKLTDLREIPATLCQGSYSFEGEAELVYVGKGDNESYYKEKMLRTDLFL